MNFFHKVRMRQLQRAAYDAGQWVGRTDPLEADHDERVRWSFDPRTALFVSAGIIVLSIILVWGASATPSEGTHDITGESPATHSSPHSNAGDTDANTQGAGQASPVGGDADADIRSADQAQSHKSTQTGDSGGVHPRRNTAQGGKRVSQEASDDTPPHIVHVAGAVNTPGIVTVPPGSRAYQAIEAAGGLSPDAAPYALNLAAPVTDGQYLYVPTLEQATASPAPLVAPQGHAHGQVPPPGISGQARGCIDINTADASELQNLTGVGPALSERIVAYRQENGAFARLEDLDSVPGIGIRMVNKIRDQVCP